MSSPERVHDRAILDALETIGGNPYEGEVWRITRKGRDPLRGSAAQGRWSPNGQFEVLYTSLEKEGALAEVGYRLSLEPIWPSLMEHEIHAINVKIGKALRLEYIESLARIGVDAAKYGGFDYSATQAVAAAAHFLDFDGLIVPSARFSCLNLVVFLDHVSENDELAVRHTAPVDWEAWREANRR